MSVPLRLVFVFLPCALGEEELPNDGLHHEDVIVLTAATCAGLIVLSVIIDMVSEGVGEHLEQRVETHDPHRKRRVLGYMKLWNRFQGEVTTLGFLTMTVWIFSKAGFFTWATETWKEHWLPEADEGGAEESPDIDRRLDETLGGEKGDGTSGEEGEGVEAAVSPSGGGCAIFLPRSGEWLNEHVETVHISMFIAMCFYFLLNALAAKRYFAKLSRYEQAERDGSVSAAQSAPSDLHQSDSHLQIRIVRPTRMDREVHARRRPSSWSSSHAAPLLLAEMLRVPATCRARSRPPSRSDVSTSLRGCRRTTLARTASTLPRQLCGTWTSSWVSRVRCAGVEHACMHSCMHLGVEHACIRECCGGAICTRLPRGILQRSVQCDP